MSHEQVIEAVRTYLELSSPGQLQRTDAPDHRARVTHREHIAPAGYLELYDRIGGPWLWRDRFAWTEVELASYLASADVRVYTLDVDGKSAGFFELKRQEDAVVEIMYFGLDQHFIGRRLGGWMLTRAVEEAFVLGAARVVVNTCTLDAPHALPNYIARGFVIMREERYNAIVPLTRATTTGSPAPTPASTAASTTRPTTT